MHDAPCVATDERLLLETTTWCVHQPGGYVVDESKPMGKVIKKVMRAGQRCVDGACPSRFPSVCLPVAYAAQTYTWL